MLTVLERTPVIVSDTARPWSVFIKVDCGYHRAGRDAHGDAVVALCTAVAASPSARFRGLYSHSGDSYNCAGHGVEEVRSGVAAVIESERSGIAGVAHRLRDAGCDVPTVSVGATPSISVSATGDQWRGCTEVQRPVD